MIRWRKAVLPRPVFLKAIFKVARVIGTPNKRRVINRRPV
jgi:hypothetical protein